MYELNLSFQLCNKFKKKEAKYHGHSSEDQRSKFLINHQFINDIDGRFYTLTASRVIANIEHAKESDELRL